MSEECFCRQCGIEMDSRRSMLGYELCMSCGESSATQARKSWTVVPMPKSNYILVTDLSLLNGLNSSHKGGVK